MKYGTPGKKAPHLEKCTTFGKMRQAWKEMRQTWKNESQSEKWDKCEKNEAHLDKCVTRKNMRAHLEKWDTLGKVQQTSIWKVRHTRKNEAKWVTLKKIGHT